MFVNLRAGILLIPGSLDLQHTKIHKKTLDDWIVGRTGVFFFPWINQQNRFLQDFFQQGSTTLSLDLKFLIWMNDNNVSTWCLVLLATLCFIYNFWRTFTNNLRDCFVWLSLPPNCYQLFPRQPWKCKMGYLKRNELQRPVPNPRISHTLIHFLGKNPSWTQYLTYH